MLRDLIVGKYRPNLCILRAVHRLRLCLVFSDTEEMLQSHSKVPSSPMNTADLAARTKAVY